MYIGLIDKYDFVFIDVGPSLGVLNRLVLLFTDGFIMPTSSDIFCLRAVDNISKAIEQWIQTFKKLQRKYYDNKGHYYQLNNSDVAVKPMFWDMLINNILQELEEENAKQ